MESLFFNEENIFSSCPSLIKEMREGNKPSAKEYLKGKYKFDKREKLQRIQVNPIKEANEDASEYKHHVLTAEERTILTQFGHHTIEALLIHILSCVFWCEHTISVVS